MKKVCWFEKSHSYSISCLWSNLKVPTISPESAMQTINYSEQLIHCCVVILRCQKLPLAQSQVRWSLVKMTRDSRFVRFSEQIFIFWSQMEKKYVVNILQIFSHKVSVKWGISPEHVAWGITSDIAQLVCVTFTVFTNRAQEKKNLIDYNLEYSPVFSGIHV